MSAPAEAVPAAKPRKPRGISKKLRALLDEAEHKGYERGITMPRDPWPGAIAALVLAGSAFAFGAWLF